MQGTIFQTVTRGPIRLIKLSSTTVVPHKAGTSREYTGIVNLGAGSVPYVEIAGTASCDTYVLPDTARSLAWRRAVCCSLPLLHEAFIEHVQCPEAAAVVECVEYKVQ